MNKAILTLLLMGLASPVLAQTGTKTLAQRNDANKPATATILAPTSIQGLMEQFDQVKIEDLTIAIAYAESEDDKVALPCYREWLAQVQRLADVRAKNPDPEGLHIVTTFQKARNLVKRLDTSSPLRVACAALAADAKGDVRQLIGGILSGVLLKTMLP